jgi:hypothetical protein
MAQVAHQANICHPLMNARLIEGRGHRPLILFEDGRVGIPVNLHFLSRNDFLSVLGRQVEVLSRLSEIHYTVRLPGAPEHMLPWTCKVGRRGLGSARRQV